jgi:hypothetical protein
MRFSRQMVFTILLAAFPVSASAQATLTGIVRDPSDAVLPGVTVEATSPALIEKLRTVITDATGQYRITELPPGTYTVTFTLSGFSIVRREGVEVTGAGTITINANMAVGSLSETVTVTGETPVVDTQSTRRESVLVAEVINQLPVSRGYGDIMLAIPTLQGGPLNASVNALSVLPNFFTIHGGRGNEGNIQVDGMTVAAAFNGGGVSGFAYDVANAQEMQVTLSGALGEAETGGPTLNLVAPSGGNRFGGKIFFSNAGEWSQGSNLDNELRAFGITEQAALIKSWDVSGTIGGPIKRDRVWFFFNYRDYGNHTDIPGLYANLHAGDPTKWTYVEDRSLKARAATSKTIASGRLTAQVTPRNKVGFYVDHQLDCDQGAQNRDSGSCRPRGENWVLGSSFFGSAWSPEAISNYWDGYEAIRQITWSSPVTSKLILEAGLSSFVSRWGWMKQPGAPLGLTSVLDVSPSLRFYRSPGLADMQNNWQETRQWRASGSYVTGAHNFKLGYRGAHYIQDHELQGNDTGLTYLFAAGFPLNFTMRIRPWDFSNRTQMHAVYVQDQWTVRRATVLGALRYDRAFSYFPAEHNGAPITRFNAQPITFPRTDGVKGYNDITPRIGVAYDLFGNGKTSVKVNLGKYLQAANNDATYIISNPTTSFQHTGTRNWFDANGNYLPDCNLLNPLPNGECTSGLGNFGNPNILTQVNPEVLEGWGVRPYDWALGATVQQEIVPRVALEAGYHRRWFGNFFVTDNILIGPADFNRITVTAPQNPRLPDGGGFQETFFALRPGASTAVQNRYTFANEYGHWAQYWQGVDITLTARPRNGLVMQVGTSTGRGVLDNCEVFEKVPEMTNTALTNPTQNLATQPWQPATSCKVAEKVLTQLRGNASYILPRIDVLLSGIFRSQPNAQIAGGNNLGSNGTALAANYITVDNLRTVNLLQPGQNYADRINELDLRVSKIFRFDRTRTSIGIDILNVFNANTATMFQQNFTGTGVNYLQPQQILNPRFVRFNVTVDY